MPPHRPTANLRLKAGERRAPLKSRLLQQQATGAARPAGANITPLGLHNYLYSDTFTTIPTPHQSIKRGTTVRPACGVEGHLPSKPARISQRMAANATTPAHARASLLQQTFMPCLSLQTGRPRVPDRPSCPAFTKETERPRGDQTDLNSLDLTKYTTDEALARPQADNKQPAQEQLRSDACHHYPRPR